MVSLNSFIDNLSERLGLDDSYKAQDLPMFVKRVMRSFLRDYNFPKSIRRNDYTAIIADQQSYTLPDDFKKPLQVRFYDDGGSSTVFGKPLVRTGQQVLPDQDGIARAYWIEGLLLYTDIKVPAADAADTNLRLLYQSNDPDYCSSWLLGEYEDILFTFCMYRGATEYGKTELAQLWAPLYARDERAIAIYQNELEFNDFGIVMSEVPTSQSERYPPE